MSLSGATCLSVGCHFHDKYPAQCVDLQSRHHHDYRSNPVNGEVYSIQHYVIKFVSDL